MMNNDPYNLSRFTSAQEPVFEIVLRELSGSKKRSHWMWFIFPQLEGLGYSAASRYYSIKSEAEAREYLNHPVLGPRLVNCAETLLAIDGKTAGEIFGFPDDMKLRSSMTLFALITDPKSVFSRVLEKFFDGKWDEKTEYLYGQLKPGKA